MEEIPIAEHGISRAIFSTLLNYPVPNRNGKIMLKIYRNKISKLTYIYGIISENNDFLKLPTINLQVLNVLADLYRDVRYSSNQYNGFATWLLGA